jgi:hypothetical protein
MPYVSPGVPTPHTPYLICVAAGRHGGVTGVRGGGGGQCVSSARHSPTPHPAAAAAGVAAIRPGAWAGAARCRTAGLVPQLSPEHMQPSGRCGAQGRRGEGGGRGCTAGVVFKRLPPVCSPTPQQSLWVAPSLEPHTLPHTILGPCPPPPPPPPPPPLLPPLRLPHPEVAVITPTWAPAVAGCSGGTTSQSSSSSSSSRAGTAGVESLGSRRGSLSPPLPPLTKHRTP